MRPDFPGALVIVVAYNSASLMVSQSETLATWLRTEEGSRLAVINNSPGDDSLSIVRDAVGDSIDHCLLIENEQNSGFAPAVNVALGAARARWGRGGVVVLLNPDVVTDAGTLAGLVLRVAPDVAVAAPLLLAPVTGAVDRGVARRNWTRRSLVAEVAGFPGAARFLGAPHRNIRVQADTGLVAVDITSGAFMAIDNDLLGEGLDTRVPMYFEDQELCHRARRAGRTVAVCTDLAAIHLGGHSRKSHTAAQRDLRTLELAEAPALSLKESSGVPLWQSRVLVGVGGVVRVLGIGPGALIVKPSPFWQWVGGQVRLAAWFVRWSVARPSAGPSIDLSQ